MTCRLTIFTLLAAGLRAQEFSKDIAPIFAANCIACHAANVKMGSLNLDTMEGIKAGGNHGAILVPGKAEESRLYLMIAGKMSPAMPLSGKALAAGEIETIRKWIDGGAKAGEPVQVSKLNTAGTPNIKPKVAVKAQIGSIAYRPDGRLLALGSYKEVRLADPSGKVIGALTGHAEQVRSVAFSPDGSLLAAAGGLPARKGEVKIWDVEKRAVVRTIEGHTDCIYAVAFSPDGKTLATSSYDKLIKIWETATGKEVRTLKDHIDAVYDLAFTPDGKRLLSAAADRTVKVWDMATGERLYTLGEPTDGLNTLAIHPSGKMVAAGGLDKTIRIWSLGDREGKLLNSLIAHEDAILRLAWSPDGKSLVSASADKTIKIFRADDLTEIKTLAAQPDWVMSLEFAPDGKSFAAGRYDGSLTIYPVPVAQASFVGRTPWSAAGPLAGFRFDMLLASRRPTRASAADQGVRPTSVLSHITIDNALSLPAYPSRKQESPPEGGLAGKIARPTLWQKQVLLK